MVDEQDPAKRVVKRVVKKTVVRPGATGPSQQPPTAPTMRYGRPVATASKGTTRATTPVVPTAKATAQPKPAGLRPSIGLPKIGAPRTGAPKTKGQAPSVDVRAKVAGARELAGRAWWATADGVTDGAHATGTFVAARARTVAAWRLPHLSPYLASAVTGAAVGIVSVVLALISLAIFRSVRGVSAGGGLWGGITFTAVTIVAVLLGEALLRGFGTTSARLVSFLAVILTIIAMLGLFLDLVDGVAGLVLVPLLLIAGHALSRWLIDLAESAPAEAD